MKDRTCCDYTNINSRFEINTKGIDKRNRTFMSVMLAYEDSFLGGYAINYATGDIHLCDFPKTSFVHLLGVFDFRRHRVSRLPTCGKEHRGLIRRRRVKTRHAP